MARFQCHVGAEVRVEYDFTIETDSPSDSPTIAGDKAHWHYRERRR